MAFKIFSELLKAFERDAKGLTMAEIPPDHVEEGATPGPALRGNQGYFRIWVERMFLAQDREWFGSRYPSVTSFVTFNFGGRDTRVEIASIAGPDHLKDVDKEHLDRVISVNQVICPTVPFRGGTVEIEAGLLSMEARDDLRRFLNAMGAVASLAAVPQLSAALTVADKLATGAKQFAGASGNRLMLGYQNTFVGDDGEPGDRAGNELRERQIAVINAPMDDPRYEPDRLWLQNNEVRVGDSSGGAKALTGVDWMVLRIETLSFRDDWENLTDIGKPLKRAIAGLTGDIAVADQLAKEAIIAAWNSEDLIDADRTRVAAAARAKYAAAKADITGEPAPAVADVAGKQSFGASDAADASDASEPSLQELLVV